MEVAKVDSTDKKVCEICHFSDTNEYDYGEWKTVDDCTVHYFCALLSSDSVQNGDDNEGICGFLVQDIRKMCKSYTKTKCVYCPKKRATVRCCAPHCRRTFHLVCGIEHGCLNEFVDPFKSFCDKHVQIDEKPYKHAPDSNCLICFEPMGEYNALTSIPACCEIDNSTDYYHKACMQKYAVKCGVLAKCPSCGNDPDGYRKFLSLRGIFCPEKDADYELSDDAFASLSKKHKRCDAIKCLCPNGRDHNSLDGEWMYYRCKYCGGAGTHAKCRDDGATGSFTCRDCRGKRSEDTQLSLSNNNKSIRTSNEGKDPNANPRKRMQEFEDDVDKFSKKKTMEVAKVKSTDKKVCEICHFSDTNEYDYGEWKTVDGCTVHHFCALMSSDSVQKCGENDGICGYLPQNFRDTETKCVYCRKKRANLRCCAANCHRSFHLVCGIKHGCLNEFVDPFQSFCDQHVQIDEKRYKHAPDSNCLMCLKPMGKYNALTSIPACCEFDNSTDYYHKVCMQEYAVIFGKFTKCPSCAEDGYREFLSLRGIFCPETDADYDLSNDEYGMLMYVRKACDAIECQCPKGRHHNRSKGDWMYYRCQDCFSAGIHAKCRDDGATESFTCRDCTGKPSEDTQQPMFSKEDEKKVWKMAIVEGTFKRLTMDLRDADDERVIIPFEQRKNLLEARLKIFFDKFDFNAKPRPPAWLT